ncbi:unnamed protein product [Pelagomonas calceolata]|uniref:biotin synthase n=1 Tax=Pelagomonas calceolata TaxID=35677 RepID=A0A8J2SQW2_9STRA|nr:unnamed protein product [Pelagomonas calceolata]
MALASRAAARLLRRRSPLACLQQGKSTAAVAYEEDEDYAPEINVTRTRPEAPQPDRKPKPYRSVADDAAVRAATQACFPTRNDWTRAEVQAVYDQPLLELIRDAGACHRAHWDSRDVQQCTLLSIKTGGCTEDCGYCSQSVRHKTHVKPTKQLPVDEVVESARRAKAAGSTRFCMGAAWRELGNKKKAFREILEMVSRVNAEGLEVCATLGMLNPEQAKQLKEAGLHAYNHNLDTSREFYPSVIKTRTYDDRLNTIQNVKEAGISVCSGGILGLGEEEKDRIGLLHELASLKGGHPESVPINALVAVEGTPIGDSGKAKRVDVFEMVRMIAAARIILPKTMVRLSAGRLEFSQGEQALMFLAGANSIFNGDKLLTTPNPEFDSDTQLFQLLGLEGLKPNPRLEHKAEGGHAAARA